MWQPRPPSHSGGGCKYVAAMYWLSVVGTRLAAIPAAIVPVRTTPGAAFSFPIAATAGPIAGVAIPVASMAVPIAAVHVVAVPVFLVPLKI